MGEGFGRPPEMFEKAHHEEELAVEQEPEEKTPEKKKIKKELIIVVPKDFELSQAKFGEALETVQLRHRSRDSIEVLRQGGYDYGDERTYPTPIYIRAGEIIGTEATTGWSGLVEGIGDKGKFAGRTQSLEQAFGYAKELITMKPAERNQTLDGVELAMQGSGGFRNFYVDSDGRHRIFTMKGLAEMGCDVTISGMKVTPLERK